MPRRNATDTIFKKKKFRPRCRDPTSSTCASSSTENSSGDTEPPDHNTVKLDDLPNEILVKIFKFLPLEDQRKSRRVSKRWRSNLNTATFFRNVNLVNAASLGLNKMSRYLKGTINEETCSLTLACSRRSTNYVLASAATTKILAEKCPLLEKITFANGKVPLEVLHSLPSTVKLIKFSHVCIIDHRGKTLVSFRDETEVKNPMLGPETLYSRIVARGQKARL